MHTEQLKHPAQRASYKKSASTNSRKNKAGNIKKHIPVSRDVRTAAAPAIPKTIHRYKPRANDSCDAEQQEFEARAVEIDVLVQKAHRELLEGNLSGANDNYITLYQKRKSDFEKNKNSIYPAMAAGYVIESKVNNQIYNMPGVELQVTTWLKGTRPDIVLFNNNGHQALLDITAAKSAGHIFNKRGNWTGHKDIIYVAELVYPSIDFNLMEAIQLSAEDEARLNNITSLKQAEAEEQLEIYTNCLIAYRQQIWDAMSSGYPFSGDCTTRQQETLQDNFALFGLQIPPSNIITLIPMPNFVEDLKLRRYSLFTMHEYKQKLLKHIRRHSLIGMGSLQD